MEVTIAPINAVSVRHILKLGDYKQTRHSMDTRFAEVEVHSGIIKVVVLRSKAVNGEFSKLVDECERMYMSFQSDFVLAMDLRKMSQLDIFQSLQWMAMFFRVMPVTKKYLMCTCICFTPELDAHVREFLKLYNPVKPFHTFHDYAEFQACVHRNCCFHDMRHGATTADS